jgi:hypothetical protein
MLLWRGIGICLLFEATAAFAVIGLLWVVGVLR